MLGLLVATVAVVMVALVSGSTIVYFLLYLVAVTVASAYLLARRGLVGLEAGCWLDRHHAIVGDVLTVTYTLHSAARLPKPWLEVHSPSTLPVTIPGRVVALGSRTERTWAARVPLPERGQFRVDALVVRAGDPFGLFESSATVGSGASVLVYPAVAALPAWSLAAAAMEGTSSHATGSPHLTPLVTSVRPYTPGDAFNRIHWRSSARHQELQVKEFEVEPSADLLLFLDLERRAHVGTGDSATMETAVGAAAALAAHALADGRGVGLDAIGLRRAVIPADHGARQRHKIMGLLAVAQAEGSTPAAEMLAEGAGRVRRGMVALLVTPSLDLSWVRPLAALRGVGATTIACLPDPLAHLSASLAATQQPPLIPSVRETLERQMRTLQHALAEHGIQSQVIHPGRPLGEQLVSGQGGGPMVRRSGGPTGLRTVVRR
jgi:uncharacterized protein (DUF58 family)